MEIDHIEDAGAAGADASALTSGDEALEQDSSAEWPPEPTPLPHLTQEAETTTDDTATDDDDDEAHLTDEDVAAATTDVVPDPAAEPTTPEQKPPSRAERIRQRAIEEYRNSPEYAAELERQAEARRAAERFEAEQARERAEAEKRVQESQAETDRRLGKYLGKARGDDGKTEYEKDLDFIASKREEIEADENEDYVDPDLKRQIREAKARIARVNENRQMATVINDLAWEGIATDYASALAFPELAALDEATKAAIARPNSLAEGLNLIRQHVLAGATRAHQQAIAEKDAAHAAEVKALRADLDGWKARAAGGPGAPETRAQAATRGGLTLERYQRMTAEEQADVKPEDIDRLTAELAAERQRQGR